MFAASVRPLRVRALGTSIACCSDGIQALPLETRMEAGPTYSMRRPRMWPAIVHRPAPAATEAALAAASWESLTSGIGVTPG